MNQSAIQLAGSSERIFQAWQVLRQSQAESGTERERERKAGK